MAEAHYVLVADGDPLALAATAGVLEDAGFRVTRAADCAGVLFQARARHPSLVLLGENLPGTGGIGALRQIRDDPALESVSVVMLGTRGAAPERHDDALDAGADGHILRPLPNASLLARVRAHLRQRERIDGYRASEAKARKLIVFFSCGSQTTTVRGGTSRASSSIVKRLRKARGIVTICWRMRPVMLSAMAPRSARSLLSAFASSKWTTRESNRRLVTPSKSGPYSP